ncbi:THUMP domain-containing protein 2 [Anabarilius grahami]|uniref:THUMP domain-containing protein 2 n=1 Tax=Anabarilius grahami TaxID=495550 RepID=A0A3N0XVX9_ANAGA|nr:THUMP domain-containing protein 2 [Anabarilius grahami]
MKHLYCTAGAGMEELLAEEVQHKLCATQVEQISAKAAAVIKQRVVGDPDIWKQTLLTWTALQEELQCSQQRGHKRRREDDEEESLTVADESTHTLTSSTHLLHEQTPSFRVSCRCSGVIARSYTSQRLGRIIGMAIKEHLGWKVDLKEPVLDVNVYLSDDHCVVGIPLLKHPLASRSYMKHNGLRSTIAWAMTSLCPKQLNDCVILDPMCGVGAVLLEAAQEYSNAVFLGMDTDTSQLQKASENLKASGMEGRVQLIRSSAMGLDKLSPISSSLTPFSQHLVLKSVSEIPLADGAVDAVLCDIPFGRKFSCSSDMPTALPRLLREMERVIRVGGHLVLLLSLQLSAQLKKTICTHKNNQHLNSSDTHNESTDTPKTITFYKSSSETSNTPLLMSSLQAQRTHKVSLGSTDAFIHIYTKIQTQAH